MSKFRDAPCPTCGTAHAIVRGAWLRARRERVGINQDEMARRVGVSPSYLCDIEHDRRNCPPWVRVVYDSLRAKE